MLRAHTEVERAVDVILEQGKTCSERNNFREELRRLIDEKIAPEQIAFLTRLNIETVKEEILASDISTLVARIME